VIDFGIQGLITNKEFKYEEILVDSKGEVSNVNTTSIVETIKSKLVLDCLLIPELDSQFKITGSIRVTKTNVRIVTVISISNYIDLTDLQADRFENFFLIHFDLSEIYRALITDKLPEFLILRILINYIEYVKKISSYILVIFDIEDVYGLLGKIYSSLNSYYDEFRIIYTKKLFKVHNDIIFVKSNKDIVDYISNDILQKLAVKTVILNINDDSVIKDLLIPDNSNLILEKKNGNEFIIRPENKNNESRLFITKINDIKYLLTVDNCLFTNINNFKDEYYFPIYIHISVIKFLTNDSESLYLNKFGSIIQNYNLILVNDPIQKTDIGIYMIESTDQFTNENKNICPLQDKQNFNFKNFNLIFLTQLNAQVDLTGSKILGDINNAFYLYKNVADQVFYIFKNIPLNRTYMIAIESISKELYSIAKAKPTYAIYPDDINATSNLEFKGIGFGREIK
jgi:hypothetical protein